VHWNIATILSNEIHASVSRVLNYPEDGGSKFQCTSHTRIMESSSTSLCRPRIEHNYLSRKIRFQTFITERYNTFIENIKSSAFHEIPTFYNTRRFIAVFTTAREVGVCITFSNTVKSAISGHWITWKSLLTGKLAKSGLILQCAKISCFIAFACYRVLQWSISFLSRKRLVKSGKK
jgi:hypothetical protein